MAPPDKKENKNKPPEIKRQAEVPSARTIERSRIETKSRSERERMSLLVDRFLSLPGMEAKSSQLASARKAINEALKHLMYAKISTQKALRYYGIQLKAQDYYLALALKESSLDPKSVSRSNAKGYFQIKFDPKTGTSKALEDVNSIFNFNFTQNDVYYSGDDPALQEKASINNAIAGILYWHICRDVSQNRQKLNIADSDRDKTAAFAYKLGMTAFKDLWQTFKPRNFDDFAKKLAKALNEKFPKQLKLPAKAVAQITDPTYGISYTNYLEIPADFKEQTVEIAGHSYDAAALAGTLRYAELIYSLSRSRSEQGERRLLPSAPKIQPISPTTAPTKSARADFPPAKAPAPTPKPSKSPEGQKGIDYETIHPPNRFMWSIADKILEKCVAEYKIPYFLDPAKTDAFKIRFIITTTINYNKKIKKNPAFNDISSDDQDPNLAANSRVYFPTKDYILNAIKSTVKVVPPPPKSPEIIATKVPMYTGPDATSLERTGKEILQYSGPNPPFKLNIPSYKGRPLHPNQPNVHGIMRPADVKYIVLHATEGIIYPNSKLYRYQVCHYLVRKDGSVELIRNENIAVDHAGRWDNKFSSKKDKKKKASMAIWNGDRDISLHSIGIEVETNMAGTYNEAQYQTLKTLIRWIGGRYAIPKGNVVTHSMIAVSDLIKYTPKGGTLKQHERFARGRKQDPRKLNWSKLDLPNNYRRVDPDVAIGTVGSHLATIQDAIAGRKKDDGWSQNTSPAMIEGLKAAEAIWRSGKKPR